MEADQDVLLPIDKGRCTHRATIDQLNEGNLAPEWRGQDHRPKEQCKHRPPRVFESNRQLMEATPPPPPPTPPPHLGDRITRRRDFRAALEDRNVGQSMREMLRRRPARLDRQRSGENSWPLITDGRFMAAHLGLSSWARRDRSNSVGGTIGLVHEGDSVTMLR